MALLAFCLSNKCGQVHYLRQLNKRAEILLCVIALLLVVYSAVVFTTTQMRSLNDLLEVRLTTAMLAIICGALVGNQIAALALKIKGEGSYLERRT